MARMRIFSAVMAAVMALGLMVSTARPAAAASEDTWRWLTYGAAAATVYGAVKKKPIIAGAGAVGTYLAYRKWKGEVNRRHDRRRGVRRTRR
jgi:hypothetical protein